ncbi:MAG: HAD-IIIC family phosphatase [Anaerolineales bacterium]|jgi:FkbH-like protein
MKSEPDAKSPIRLALLGSFTLDAITPFMVEALDRRGLRGEINLGEFGQIAQSILDPESKLYTSHPDGVIIIPAFEDLFNSFYDDPQSLSINEAEARIQERASEIQQWMQIILERLPEALCLLLTWTPDQLPFEHILDPQAPGRGQVLSDRWCELIRKMGEISPRVVIVDWAHYCSKYGTRTYTDPRLWYLGRIRLNPEGFAALSDLIAAHIAAYRNMAKKVAVVDLDNTLWGGIIGEDGMSRLVLGEDGLGLAYVDFQRELRKLHDAGIVLAICSKNNPDDAWLVFEQHEAMVLKRSHFAAARINWQDKATNMREISRELNLGMDSFVFFDDNPVERDWVRTALPEVEVPELPEDPGYRPQFIREMASFQRIQLTKEDLQRAESYRAQSLRSQLKGSVASLDEFIASLEQVVKISPVHEGSLARAAQMCQRTNQFNLTTKRHTLADLENMIADSDHELYTISVKDRYGDSGITGLAIMRLKEDEAHIDTFLLSCRVLGRKIEDGLLAFLADRARERGTKTLFGYYYPTKKNVQVADFYQSHGFAENGENQFQLELAKSALEFPSSVEFEIGAGI